MILHQHSNFFSPPCFHHPFSASHTSTASLLTILLPLCLPRLHTPRMPRPGGTHRPSSHPNMPAQPRTPMVRPSDILRQVTSHRIPLDPPASFTGPLDWHTILGHAGEDWTTLFCRHHHLPAPTALPPCQTCTPHRMLRSATWTLPRRLQAYNTGPFRTLRCDLLRLFPQETFTTRNYVLVVQDVYSHYVALRFLHSSHGAPAALRSFLTFHSRQRRCHPDLIFTATPHLFRPACRRQTRLCHAPRMASDDLRTRILFLHRDSGLPLADWPYMCKFLFFLANRFPRLGQTPRNIWTNVTQTLPRLHHFGCDVYFKTPSATVRRGTFLGYSPLGLYMVRDIFTRNIHLLRDAIFQPRAPSAPQTEPYCVATATTTSSLPRTYGSAMRTPDANEWQQAMNTELSTLKELNVWTLVPPPTNAKIIPTQWVFTQKFHPDGTLRKYKARLVVTGNRQLQGEDYISSFSPVVKHSSVRVLLAIAAKFRYSISFLDVTNAYCWGTLQEETFCKQPPGFEQHAPDGSPLVCRLHKSLYGLPQSGRCWNQRLTQILIDVGLRQSDYDPCVFYKTTPVSFFAMSAYVDDNFVVSSNDTLTSYYLNKIKDHIKIVPVHDQLYLGMKIQQTSTGFRLHQENYVTKILTRFGMQDSKPVNTPLVVSQSTEQLLHARQTPLLQSSKPYQELLGCLLYLANVSRPDVTFPVIAMSVHGHAPMQHHMGVLKRILRYLKGTPTLGINYHTSTVGSLYAASDASLASFPNSKSVTGTAIFLGAVPILWRTKQQSLVALSSCEAETYAIAETCRDLIPIRGLLTELAPSLIPSPTIIYTDSYSAMFLILNGGSTRTKHFHKRVNFVQDYLKTYDLALQYMPTNTIPADMLTKPTTRKACQTTLSDFFSITTDFAQLAGRADLNCSPN